MASRSVEMITWAVVALVTLLTLGSAVMVALRAETWALGPADLAALRFTVTQAAVSAGVSVLLAIPTARALMRRRFIGRAFLIRLMAAPFVLPVVVAVLGLLAVFGRNGPVNMVLVAIGLPPLSIFGFHGVVLAHVFLNLPLAVRMILLGWQAIPQERMRLAASLGLTPLAMWRHLERPMLRSVIPGVAAVIFLLCLTSFAVALTLGGGPRASTIELSIYQALRFDFNLGRAALLAALQFGLCGVTVLLTARFASPSQFGAGLDRTDLIFPPTGVRKLGDVVMIAAATLFLLTPLIAVALQGAMGLATLPDTVWPAALRSIIIALISASLATVAALALALAAVQRRPVLEIAAMLPLAASGLVMGTGLFLMAQPYILPERLALPVTILVNATLSLPFLFRLLLPEAQALNTDYSRLSQSLSLEGMFLLRWVTLPRLRRPLGFGGGLAAALSMGDLGVIALFAGDRGATLPLVVQRLMGAYRMQSAAGAALLLVAISFALFWAIDRLGGRDADA